MNASPAPVQFPLAMNLGEGALRTPAAWFVPGGEAGQWLEEATRWGVSLADAQLYLIPTAIDNPRPCGALVLLKDGKPTVSAAIAYAQIDHRLFFPADAKLDPEVSPEEVSGKLLWDVQVMHPAAGLIGFRREDAIAVDALLAPPPRRPANWNCAEPGVSPRPPLTSVLPEAMPSFFEILETGRDDIGSSAEEDLPRLPDESPIRDALGHAVNKGFQPLMAAIVRWLSKKTSPPGSEPPGQGKSAGKNVKPPRQPGKFRQWATAKLKQMNDALQERRNRELNRLLSLLQSDPDTGLQFALPLHDVASRGVAAPSDALGRRSVDFNLSTVFGGNRPGDQWSVPDDLQKQLRDRYRESANRELNLGRYSRAAYIFAHLLGDLASAADALKRGRSFREAAVIYKDKLNNPKAAADCLAEGGLLLEAIPLYRSLHLYNTAGDLHERLGQVSEARECYRQAVAQFRDRGDVISAAQLLESKLSAPDEALALLASTWPDSNRAGVCLRAWFAMCGRLARHDDVNARIGVLGRGSFTSAQNLTLVQTLCSVAGKYPNPAVRAHSADTARVLAGNRLGVADAAQRRELVEAVVSLVPADKLLARDGTRLLSRTRPAPPPIAVRGAPQFVRSFRLSVEQQWQTVVAIPGGFLALGTRGARCTIVRGTWDGRMVSDSCPDHQGAGDLLLLAPGQGDQAVLARLGAGQNCRVGRLTLPRIDVFQNDLIADAPGYVDSTCFGACREENGTTWVLRGSHVHSVIESLNVYGAGETLLSSHSLPFEHSFGKTLVTSLPMAARKGTVYIGHGPRLIRFRAENPQPTWTDLPFSVRTLTPSPPFTLTRLIAGFSSGCAVVQDCGDYQLLARDLIDPVATFTPDGPVIVIGGGRGHVYRPGKSQLIFDSDFDAPSAPIAVLPAGHGGFAVFDAQGGVAFYRLWAE